MNKIVRKKYNLYDTLVWILIYWCIFQDFALCIILKYTGVVIVGKILFFSKDVLMLLLFIVALQRTKLPQKFWTICFVYYMIVVGQIIRFFVAPVSGTSITSMLSSVRGLILLPTLTIIGMAIRNKEAFMLQIKKYYWFLAFLALLGFIEFFADIFVGTKGFWMDFLRLEDLYNNIKGQAAGLENGTPGNWYTDIGQGYRTQKRLISIWAAPLTAGFVLLLPSLYYTIRFLKKKGAYILSISREEVKDVLGFFLCAVALCLTFTRQTIFPYLIIAMVLLIHYKKKNQNTLIIGGVVIFTLLFVLAYDSIVDYLYNGSTKVHIMAIQRALSKVEFWGRGIASFGTRFAGAIATESQYITVIGQLGFLAIIPYVYILIYPVLYCNKKTRYLEGEARIIIYSICLSGLGFMLAGIVSETVAAFTSIAQYYIFVGFAWAYCKEYGKRELG